MPESPLIEMRKVRWSPEQVQQVQKWISEDRMTYRQIAQRLQIAVHCLKRCVLKYGIQGPPVGRPGLTWPIEKIRGWIEADGLTHEQVAERIGSAPQTVGKLCAKHGIHCQRRGPRSAEGHPEWEGGVTIDKHGYRLVYSLNHPMARKRGNAPPIYVPEHRLVMANHLGRMLDPKEVVHHVNGDKRDNRIDNLELYTSNAQHLRDELAGVPQTGRTYAQMKKVREEQKRRNADSLARKAGRKKPTL